MSKRKKSYKAPEPVAEPVEVPEGAPAPKPSIVDLPPEVLKQIQDMLAKGVTDLAKDPMMNHLLPWLVGGAGAGALFGMYSFATKFSIDHAIVEVRKRIIELEGPGRKNQTALAELRDLLQALSDMSPDPAAHVDSCC